MSYSTSDLRVPFNTLYKPDLIDTMQAISLEISS